MALQTVRLVQHKDAHTFVVRFLAIHARTVDTPWFESLIDEPDQWELDCEASLGERWRRVCCIRWQ